MKKTALVTGGTKGIGLAIAKALLNENYTVILTYASDQVNAMQVNKDLFREYGKMFHIIQKSMEKENDIKDFLSICKSDNLFSNGLDVVVLNAGCTDRTSWKELNWNQWMHVMDVNINAPSELLRGLDSNLNYGASIIFISSDMSIYPHAVSVPYTVSKAAVNGLTLSLVKEYSDRGIRVNAILPGFVDTPWQKKKPEEQKQRICDKIALHRFAKPEEIAETTLNIIHSSYINGALIKVDGGYSYK